MKKSILILTILLSTYNLKAQVGINTDNPEATLHVNGNLKVTNTPIIPSGTALVVDPDGNIGTAATIPAKVMLIQSGEDQVYPPNSLESNNFNNDIPIVVTWKKKDIKTNNIVTFDENNNIFIINEAGMYELSGYLNYKPSGTNPTNFNEIASWKLGVAVINTAIQLYDVNDNLWKNIAGARALLNIPSIASYAETINIPPILYQLDKGNKVRMIFYRPGTGALHGTTGDFGIVKPQGIEFTKGIKIVSY